MATNSTNPIARTTKNRDLGPTINAAQRWVENCLVGDNSVFTTGALWTPETVAEVRGAFVDHPDEGEDDFSTKLKRQMQSASQSAQRIMAEMVWALLLFPSNIKVSTKRQQIGGMWLMAGERLREDLPLFSDDVLSGIGSAGPGYNTNRWREMVFLISLVGDLKQRRSDERRKILSDYDVFIEWMAQVPQEGDRQFRHMLRFFCFPDRVERMSTNRERWTVLAGFGVAPEKESRKWSDRQLDDALENLRRKLQGEYPNETLDFYDPPLQERWMPSNRLGKEDKIITKRRFWVEKTLVKGRPDRQSGDNAVGKALWSPQLAKRQRDLYRLMREVRAGDVIFHLVDNEAVDSFSIVATAADSSFVGIEGTEWAGRPAYRIPLRDHEAIEPAIERKEFLHEPRYRPFIEQLLESEKGLFFNKEFNLNEGSYLTEAPLKLVQIWSDIQIRKTGKGFPEAWNIPPLTQPASSDAVSYWWLNANPKKWDFRAAPVGSVQTYTAYNEDGNKRHKFKHFTTVKPGDLLIGYITSPDKEIVAECEITKALSGSPGREEIEFRKTRQFAVPVSWNELQSMPELANCEPFVNNQGSLFAVTAEEYDAIRAVIDERNLDAQLAKAPAFTKADALKDLFMAPETFDTILARLRRKKALILQGPPGVGKTFIARRLACALMGERDERRLAIVQFHPSYGYEDFVQGYRPTRTGLKRQDGLLHQFARLARNDLDRDWCLIIDEVNRGNLAKIFGELLMLIEADKRGPAYAIPLTYSERLEETFYLPGNIHFIGTMNTADRSLAMVDYALRRRFAFVTLDPALESPAFADWLKARNASDTLIQRIRSKIGALNDVIKNERDLGYGFCIGHSFFCPPDGHSPDDGWYREVVESEIQPLLEEYFDSRDRVEKLVAGLLA